MIGKTYSCLDEGKMLNSNSMKLQESFRVQQEVLQLLKNKAPLPCIATAPSIEEMDLTPATNKRLKRVPEIHSQLYQERLCRLKRCCCGCHDTMSLQARFWPLKFSCSSWTWKACNKSSCRNAKNASIWISLTQIGIRAAVCINLDVMFNFQGSYISPSLSFQRVVRRTAPGFKLLWELQTGRRTDWGRAKRDLLELFETGKASPRDIDPDGNTWLEVCSALTCVYLICLTVIRKYCGLLGFAPIWKSSSPCFTCWLEWVLKLILKGKF